MGAQEALQLGLVARTAECAVTSALQMADQVRVSILILRLQKLEGQMINEKVGHD